MGLFSPAWMSKNEQKALDALSKITEQKTLAEIVKSDKPLKSVRSAALLRITDQQLLPEVAWHIWYISKTDYCSAVARMDRIDLLKAMEADCSFASPYDNWERIVSKRIYELEEAEKERAVRGAFSRLCNDEDRMAFLMQFGSDYSNKELCKTVVGQVEDVSRFRNMATQIVGMHDEAIYAIIDRVYDDAFLLELLKESKNIRGYAGRKIVNRVDDAAILLELKPKFKSLPRYVVESIMERLCYNAKQIYLEGFGDWLSPNTRKEATKSLTLEEIKTLPLSIKLMHELENNPFVQQAVLEKSSTALVNELIAEMRNLEKLRAGSGLYSATWEAKWLRLLYRNDKWKAKIDACRGMQIRKHDDLEANGTCRLSHEDFPEEYFDPEK